MGLGVIVSAFLSFVTFLFKSKYLSCRLVMLYILRAYMTYIFMRAGHNAAADAVLNNLATLQLATFSDY